MIACLPAGMCVCLLATSALRAPCSVRGLQPVGEARLADGEVWTASGSAAAIALLQQEVQALQTATDMQQWLR